MLFTGIVEEMGHIQHIQNTGTEYKVHIRAKRIMTDMHEGDSIAVNGVCLTVTTFKADQFVVDVMPETLAHTSLAQLHVGSTVNLERAMAANGRFGGHFVSGHVDGTARIVRKQPEANAVYIYFEAEAACMPYMIPRGSVCVDGVSLTVVDVVEEANQFSVSVIPHTLDHTVLGQKDAGKVVNIECDMLAKYMHRLLARMHGAPKPTNVESLSYELLSENGFTSS